ncbi:MAG: DNA repair protein RadC [Bacteroidota bacterium]
MKYYENTPIKHWRVEDRPREKVQKKGVRSLTDAELIATLLGSGTRDLSAIDLARHLLHEFGGLKRLAQAGIDDFMALRGIGAAKASTLVVAFELARRRLHSGDEGQKLQNSVALRNYFRPFFMDLDHEQFHAVFLNRSNAVLGHKIISTGGLDSVHIDPRMVFREALRFPTTTIAFCHNHPSGNSSPSVCDDGITEKLVRAGQLMEVKVIDHVILGDGNHYSYADEGDIAVMHGLAEGRRFRRSFKGWSKAKRKRYGQ